MHPLNRWWLRRRHGAGEWAALLQAAPAGTWVSLDLETTGMDPARDHILSLAAVPVRDGKVWLSERFERRVHTGRRFGIESIRYHYITPDEASAGEPITDVVRDFLHWLDGRRLLGYYIGFDLDMLAPHVRALTGFDLPNPVIDLGDEVAACQRRRRPDGPVKLDFDHITTTLGIPAIARHSALGDAVTVGLCWLALQRKGWPAD
ncbi:exonuclease domain-containing protein [Pseudoxanthomonas mexicana]